MLSSAKTLLSSVVAACLFTLRSQAVDIPASAAVSGPVGGVGKGLKGEYWHRPVASILTDGNSTPAHRIDTQIQGFGTPDGTFNATKFVYTGNDLSLVLDWLSTDAPSFIGTTNNIDDGAFRFRGYINIAAPGIVNMGTTTDDGSRVTINGIDVIANDGSHGDTTVDADANFLAAGIYPIEITYFSGDWTSDGGHNGSPNPGDHGGDNFHLRISGADITPAQVATLLFPEIPGDLPNVRNLGLNKVGSVTNNGNGSYTVVGGGNDTWDQRDEGTYAYTEVTGDFDVQVRVESLEMAATWTKAGIMARESLSEFSRMAFPRVTPTNGANDVRFGYRTGLDASAGDSGGNHEDCTACEAQRPTNGVTSVRLSRVGNVFNAYSSPDGVNWTALGTQDTATWGGGPVNSNLYVGLWVSRHSGASLTAKAEFRDLKFNTNNAQFSVVNASDRGNPTGIRVNFNNPIGAGAFVAGNYALTASGESNVTVVTGLRLTTANDAPGRDPLTFTLEGTTSDPAVGAWELIASGDTGLGTDPGRLTVGPAVHFANTKGYVAYRLLFPTVRNMVFSGTDNSMQVSEIELLGAGDTDVTLPGDYVVGVRAVAGDANSEIAVAGTASLQNNFPAAESPPNSIDNNSGTKYLNFCKTNAGVIIAPSTGTPPPAPTVVGAAQGPNSWTVQLTTSKLQEGATYTVTVSGVSGADGSALNNSVASFVAGAGYEAVRIRVLHNKTSDSGFYYQSDGVLRGIGDVVHTGGGVFPPREVNTLFEDPIPDNGSIERFGSRISGVLIPPASGNYKFACSSDDVGHLYLSSDENPANKVQIASEPAWNGSRQYAVTDRRPAQENISATIPLVGGKPYYLEYIYNEGGGGNNGSATWQPPGAPAIANNQLPIGDTSFVPSRLVDGSVFHALGPIRIVRQPASQSVTALLPVTFTVGLDGTPGYRYQWRRNGQAIPGATGPSYTIAAAQLSDDQVNFSVEVANEFSSATSGNALLTVLVPTPPHVTGARSDTTFTRVFVSFDNRVEPASANNPLNYTLSGGVTVNGAARDATARGVVLTTATPLAEDTTYTLTVKDIHDETGTTTLESNPTNVMFTTFAFAPGFVQKEYYLSWAGGAGSVDNFITAQRNGTTPLTFACLTNKWEFNNNDQYDNYGGHMYGYFIAPVDGNYTFYFASDDFGRCFLSTDATPANLREICREPVWANRREWTGAGGGGGRVGVPSASGGPQANISGPITLTGGQRYYMETFFTEGGGGDNMGVAVQIPGAAIPANGDPGIPSSMLGVYVAAGNLQITQQPTNQTRTINGFGQFTVVASGASTLCGGGTLLYQWFSNNVAIAGANSATLVVGPLTSDANGAVFRVNVSSPGRALVSANATLTVNVDNIPPVLVYARTDDSFNTVHVNWNELMAQGPAIEAGNYVIKDSAQNRIDVSTVDFTPSSGSNVTLHLSSRLAPNTDYTLEIDFQTDLAGNQTAPFGNPVEDPANGVRVPLHSFTETPGYAKFSAYLGLTVPNNNDLSPLLTSPNYPFNPSFSFYSNVVNWPQSTPDINNYGMRWAFFFTAPADGTYKFEPSHDDAAEIFVALDGIPDNKTMVFHEDCCNGFGAAEGGYSVALTTGQHIYIELAVIEAGGGDYAGLSVTLPDGTYKAPIPSQYISYYADTTGGSITINQQPANQLFSGTITAFAPDFNANDGGFYVETPIAYAGAWHYNGVTGSWQEDGQDGEDNHPNTSLLLSPALVVKADGAVILNFSHRYSREQDWDGAQVRISVNGGPFTAVPGAAFTQNGYNGTVRADSSSVLAGQAAFTGTSPGYSTPTFLTSIANLGTFTQGDVIRLQFIAASDTNTRGTVPNWEIDSVSSANLDAYPGVSSKTVTFSVAATGENFLGPNQPLFYQWFRDDGTGFVAIPGATASTYTFAPAPSDNGAQFRVDLSLIGAQATSAAATLTVGSPAALKIVKSGNQITISWTGSLCLQESSQVGPGAVWTASAVANGVPFTPPTTGNKFYRLGPCGP